MDQNHKATQIEKNNIEQKEVTNNMEITVPVKGAPDDLHFIVQLRFFNDRHLVIVTDSKSKSHGTIFQVETRLDETSSPDSNPAVSAAAATGSGPVTAQRPPQEVADDFLGELERQMMSEEERAKLGAKIAANKKQQQQVSSSCSSRRIPICIEIFPVLGSARDNQWALLLIRRITTAIAESFVAPELAEKEEAAQQRKQKQQEQQKQKPKSPFPILSEEDDDEFSAVQAAMPRLQQLQTTKSFSMSTMMIVHVPAVLDEDDGMKHGAAVMEAVRGIETQLRRKLRGGDDVGGVSDDVVDE